MIVFDSSAWLEYFAGSEKGKEVKRIIESKEEIGTPSVCVAEIKRKYQRENKPFASRIQFIMLRSKVTPVTADIALLAAELSIKHKLYMIDAFVYACSRNLNAELLTGDNHFNKLEGVQML